MMLQHLRAAFGSRSLKIALTAALLIYIFVRYDIRIGPETLARLTAPGWLALAPFVVLVVNPILSASRLKVLLACVGVHETHFALVRIIYLASVFGLLLPTTVGPDAVRLVMIERRHPSRRGSTSAAVVADKALGFLILALLGLSGALLSAERVGSQLVWLMAAVAAAVGGALVVTTHPRMERFVEYALEKLRAPSIMSGYFTTAASSLASIPLGHAFPRVLPLALGYQLGMVTVVWGLFRAFGLDIPFATHVAFVPIILIVATLPASIGGFGLREGAFVHFYGLIGVAPDISFAVSVLLFMLTMGLGAAVGGLWAMAEHVRAEDVVDAP